MSLKILFDKNKCTGAYTCVQEDSELWIPEDDGKVNLADSVETKPGVFERKINEDEAEKARLAAATCPVAAIQIIEEK